MSPAKLLLVDGMSALYRAFYAIKELSTKEGRPTNAVFGFIRMLDQLKEHYGPTHWAVIFDGGLPEERVEILADYKAQRQPTPDALPEQIDTAEEYLDKANIAWTRHEGEEADDVLASIAVWAEKEAASVLIASTDKDFYQLVNENINMVSVAGKSGVMGPAEVFVKTGVKPDQIVEWLALIGDSVDNIPGVPSVGPKTAGKLLNEFGSLSAMWERVEEIDSARLKGVLLENRKIVERNIKLIGLNKAIQCPFSWKEMENRLPADAGKLLSLFEELEFHSMAKKLREPELFGG